MRKTVSVVIDENIPYIKGILEPFCNVIYLKGEMIDSKSASNADSLIIRTRTNCNSKLLEKSRVNSIFTATIGEDHIDKDLCREMSIDIYSAPGCNSMGVVQYVITSLFALDAKKRGDLLTKKIGIIGAGNVGEGVAKVAGLLGFNVMRCDPPLKSLGISDKEYFDVTHLLKECEIITMHVPLDKSTANMCSEEFFSRMRAGSLFINTARGEITDEQALIGNSNRLGAIITDVWRGEPQINPVLLGLSDISTTHIAGYSIEGKMNATSMTVRSFAKHYDIEPLKEFSISPPTADVVDFKYNRELSIYDNLNYLFQNYFAINQESTKLKRSPEMFEKIRSEYKYRQEFTPEVLNFAVDILSNRGGDIKL